MKNSFFDGTALQLIGWTILVSLLTTVTFGFGYPWGMCMMERWKAKHTTVSSARLKFVGTGAEFFWIWIFYAIAPSLLVAAAFGGILILLRPYIENISGGFWLFLVVVAGLVVAYIPFYVRVQVKKWVIKHTEFEDYPTFSYQERQANAGGASPQGTPNSVAQGPEITAEGPMEAALSLGTLFVGVPVAIAGLGFLFFGRFLEGGLLFALGVVLLLVCYFKQ